MKRSPIEYVLVCGVLLAVGFYGVPWADKQFTSYINRLVDEHIAGITLNSPPPPEQTAPIIDGFDSSRVPPP